MKRAALLLAALCSCSLLFAQEASLAPEASSGDVTSDYRLDEDGNIRQRITWTRANAYFYEVEIEKIGPGAVWALEMKERTEQNFLELALPPGMYRYRILNYNVLGRVGATSEWTGIRVFVAKQPAAESCSPAAWFVDSPEEEFTLTLRGRNLVEEAQVYIAAAKAGAKPVQPFSVTYSADESSITAVFRAEGLSLGAYEVVIINPGGMKQVRKDFSVGFSRPLDINASLGYAPVLPLYGYLFNAYNDSFYPAGFYGRVSVVPVKRLWGWIGFELTPHYGSLQTKNSKYRLSGNMIDVYTDMLYQKWMRHFTLAVNLRLGGGLTVLSNVKFNHKDGSQSKESGSILFALNGGASVQWIVWKNIFVEAGLEYVQFVSSQSPVPGLIRFNAAVGRKF
jgi:hypothetical protein